MSKKANRNIAPAILFFCGLFLLMSGRAYAEGALGSDWGQFLGGLRDFTETDVSGEDLALGFLRNSIRIVKYITGALAVLFGMLYALTFIFAGDKEETLTKRKKNFVSIGVAFVLLMAGGAIADIFNPEKSSPEALIDFGAARDQLRDIANYIKWLLGSVLVLVMTISGLRLITAQGKEDVITKQKMHLVWSGIGMGVMLLATNIINAFYIINEPGLAPEQSTIAELMGIVRLMLVFLGPIAILFTIYAGFLYLTNMGEEEKVTKAKKMVTVGISAIVFIYISYALVSSVVRGLEVPLQNLESMLPFSANIL